MAVLGRPSLKAALAYLAAFVVLTVPLAWLWDVWGREAYGNLFARVAGSLYALVGLEQVPVGSRERYVNFVPFLALMALTPGFGVGRRLAWTALGLVLLFVSHLVLNLLAAFSELGGAVLPAPVALVSDAMPFVLWAVFARDFIREVAGRGADAGDDAPQGAP